MRKTMVVGLLLAATACRPSGNDAACTKDSDCKGDRICTAGACAAPDERKATPTAPPSTTSSPAVAAPSAARFGYVRPPATAARAIVREAARFDSAEAGRIPAWTEVEVVDAVADGSWFGIRYKPILGERTAWIHRDVFQVDQHAPNPEQRPGGGQAPGD